jgi:2-aminobenzoate-CoA ligase
MALFPSAHVDTFTRDRLPSADQWPALQFTLPELIYPQRLNCARRLLDDALAEGHGDRPAIHWGEQTWTYAQVQAAADRIAHVLVRDCGVVPGNRVLLRGANTPLMFAAWFGVMKAGAVAVTTMPLLRAGELAQIIDKAQVSVALCEHALRAELDAAQVQAPVLTTLLTFGAADATLDQAMAAHEAPFAAVDTAQDDVALLAFTSGTTGQPKACMHFHRDVLAMCDTFARHIVRATPEDVFCGTPPIAFTFGLGALLAFPFHARASVALPDKASPTAKAEAVQRHRASIIFTSPTAYRALLGQLDDFDLSSVRVCVSAGEHLPRATWEAWCERTGLRIIDGIGATEMIHIFLSARDDDIRPGSTGKPVPGYTATLLDEDGAEITGPGTGLLAVRGPTGCRYMDDERQARYVRNGWNVTGDTYRRDEDGYFWYEARADDMIISSGYNIAGPEVEMALAGHAAVLECAVVGAPDEERGQIVKAYVVLQPGHAPTPALAKELQDFVKARIAPYKYPRAIAFAESLPKTQTGKLQRYRLRDMAQASAQSSPAEERRSA